MGRAASRGADRARRFLIFFYRHSSARIHSADGAGGDGDPGDFRWMDGVQLRGIDRSRADGGGSWERRCCACCSIHTGQCLAGVLLGLSILGKGFVPAVLIAPLFLIARGKRIVTLASAAMVAAPWFVLCWLRNGSVFWDDFFWKQHVARFLTPSLEHVQPFWYYIPVLLAGLFPWTPLAALLVQRRLYSDRRVFLLAAWVLYGLVFFSIARNKLPGYVLPLFPALAIVLAAALTRAAFKPAWLAACALLLVGLPTVAGMLPDALLAGLSRSHLAFAPGGLVFAGVAVLVWWLAWKQKTEAALLSVALAAGLGAVYLKYTTFPALDRIVSVRSFWRNHQAEASIGCVDGVSRTWQYGLNYYAGHSAPECTANRPRPHIVTRDRQLAIEE